MSRLPASPGRLLGLAAGFVIWSAAFVALYGMLSVGCELGWHELTLAGPLTVQRAMLLGLFALSLAAGATFLAWLSANRAADAGTVRFLDQLGLMAGWAALGSTAFTFFGVLGLSTCL